MTDQDFQEFAMQVNNLLLQLQLQNAVIQELILDKGVVTEAELSQKVQDVSERITKNIKEQHEKQRQAEEAKKSKIIL